MDPHQNPRSGQVPDLTIVILGNSGVGKSASGNTILGQPGAFESKRSFAPVTKEISRKPGTVFGKRVSVVDTPGILSSEDTIQSWCQNLRESSAPCLFLVVVKIDRFTEEQLKAAEAALRVTGDHVSKSYLLFTGGDTLDTQALADFINADPEGPLRPFVDKFAGRYLAFNNVSGGQEQVRELLEKSGHLQNATPPRADRRIVLLGLPGAGKSASGNTILGSQKFKSRSGFDPVTTRTKSRSTTVGDLRYTVVDTPGITTEKLSARKLFLEIMETVRKAQPGPHAFIIVVEIGRINKAEIRLFELLQKLFGKDAEKYSMVLFTHGDKLEGKSIENMIESNKHVKGLVSRCGGRYCVFDNTKRANREQVRHLLEKIEGMVRAYNEKYYTSEMFRTAPAGLDMMFYRMWDKIKEWFTREVSEIERQMREQGREYDRLRERDAGKDAGNDVLDEVVIGTEHLTLTVRNLPS